MITDVYYGTRNKKDYFVKTTNNIGKTYYSEPMTKKQAKQVSKKLSRMFQVPMGKVK